MGLLLFTAVPFEFKDVFRMIDKVRFFLVDPGCLGKEERKNDVLMYIKVIEVLGEKVIASAEGSLWEVRTQLPLKEGQHFLVKQEQGKNSQIIWRIVEELQEAPDQSVLKKLGLPENLQDAEILSVLRNEGLALTKGNFLLIQRNLVMLGEFSPINIWIASILTKLTHSFQPFLLRSLEVYVKFFLSSKEREKSHLLKITEGKDIQEVLNYHLKEMGNKLRLILLIAFQKVSGSSSCTVQKAISALSDGYPELRGNDYQEQRLLGGQLFAWAQENKKAEKNFYYLPFSFAVGKDLYSRCDLFIYPLFSDETGKLGWRILLNVETRNLGWVQVELTFEGSFIRGWAVVEQESTKVLFDKCWSGFAERLKALNLHISWSGCTVGIVKKFILSEFKTQKLSYWDYPEIDFLI